MNNNREIRVRFAPSPTGPLHIGGVRTALYNYLFAKKHHGTFILRIEDTDRTRFVTGAQDYIIESLRWCGIIPDEGVSVGGDYGPYIQSQRKDIYKQYADQLINNGSAYYAFDTPEELEAMRTNLQNAKSSSMQYDAGNRLTMKNSFTMSDTEVKDWIDSGKPYVIRFNMPANDNLILHDMIRGEIHVNTSTLDDKVLYKSSDEMPTYHLANIVDDHLMMISHVIRGEEWLPSLPLHYMLYKAFGWLDTVPEFAHLPLLLKPEGNGKLSKRDGDRLGFPVFPLRWPQDLNQPEIASGYRETGYYPDAFINMIALLGWNPGTEQEFFSMSELVESFSMDRVGKSGAKFNPEKAKWFNHEYLIKRSDSELLHDALPYLHGYGNKYDSKTMEHVCGLIKERLHFVKDIWDEVYFFFKAPMEYDEKTVARRWKQETPAILSEYVNILLNMDDFSMKNIEKITSDWIAEKGYHPGNTYNSIRLCLVGAAKGPHLFDIMDVIGKDETISRINKALICIK